MSANPFDSAVFGGLFADPEIAAELSDAAFVRAMIRVEAALARAQGAAGVLPEAEGAALADALDALADAPDAVPPETLAEGAAGSAVPIPALLAALRARLPAELGHRLHWGATSQDILDTALMLCLRAAVARVAAHVGAAASRLAELAEAHRATPQLGRTWAQAAAPTSFGLVCAGWLGPLTRLRRRLAELSPRVFAVQLGGAVGNLAAMGAESIAARAELAGALGLSDAPPWHAQRDRVTEIGGWLADVAGAFGRLGADLVLLSRSEIGEVRLGASGGSSTMPQKRNPVGPSAMSALARIAAAEQSALLQAALHTEARDGQAWLVEWSALPTLVQAAGGAARRGAETLAGLAPDPAAMRVNLDAAGEAPLAEAISFALAAHMPRAEAQALVKKAALAARDGLGAGLVDALRAATDAPVDWTALADPTAQLGQSESLIDEALAEWRAVAASA